MLINLKFFFLVAVALFAISQCSAVKVKVVSVNPWSLRNSNGTIKVNNIKAPTGVYSALKNVYNDIIYSTNDVDLRWIAYDNWTFSATFGGILTGLQRVNLTFHGVDTVSTIRFNDEVIGTTNNMFARYSFDVTGLLKSSNTLEIEIISPVLVAKAKSDELKAKGMNTPPDCPAEQVRGECHRNMIRKMQTSFGSNFNPAAPSMGLWKPVDLEYYEVAIMRDVDVAVRRNETHWTLDIRVFLSTGTRQNFYGNLTLIAAELLDEPYTEKGQQIFYGSSKMEFEVTIPKDRVELWWPNGYGDQKLYPLYFMAQCWENEQGPSVISRTKSQKTISVGFRTIELQEDIDDFGRSFYFKVNGIPIFTKGANYVPSSILPELSYQEPRIEHLIKSAHESHLNMLRVWGGGLYESDSFYNLTDYYGLLVWQDMTFDKATYPLRDDFVESVRWEVAQNAKRLAYHPSLCILVTNDEIELYLTKNKTELGDDWFRLQNEYKQMFMGTIRHELNVISRNDFNPRAGPMISTPSMGVEESKKELSAEPQNPNYGDVHFYDDEKDAWDPTIYPAARFISEYGFQSLPIRASWNRTLAPTDDINNILKHRQRDPKAFLPMITLISRHFAIPPLQLAEDVDAFIYLSQIAQAMAVKTATEVFRAQRTHKRTMGAIYWQLNDAWVAPTWSSIDYYGNYKVVWYWSREFMANTSIIALKDTKNNRINVTVTRDDFDDDVETPRNFNVTIFTYLWSELYYRKAYTYPITLGSSGINSHTIEMASVFNSAFTESNCFLKFVLTSGSAVISNTHVFPSKLYHAEGLDDPQLQVDLSKQSCYKGDGITFYSITITVQKPALFVYVDIYHPQVVKYKLSENGFVLTDAIKIIHIQLFGEDSACITLLMQHIRVFTLNQLYLGDASQARNQGNSSLAGELWKV